jgi:hypothetical protein
VGQTALMVCVFVLGQVKVDCGANFFNWIRTLFLIVEPILLQTSFNCQKKSMKYIFFDFDKDIFLQLK